ncbi:50S ribosomal protein L23 [Paraperlucidibaca wandonensis]|jgi:large subunit ribosomal protein L23|uniref:Large ribosomal subunit protein uL23 n=1 Tax=Paraperlucidibaca wandonensis TaxID=1268273 RepID=A0ABW3HJI4_9GAMM|nr:50S ribosomal protein L23 [Paraperlucidibaca sp.]MBQ0723749.1 50S ribosomal protein L23 [Paraperlucidibaca sp.]MBQ0843202.1 50S ribosomal protein L23 [Paraperlucidibaca sp.]|tara:strand:+ start:1906 stop:2211 length:306 start_codon:yes stop_codon:yes gene_type:complete
MSQERLLQVLLAPHVSEKATMVADKHRQVVFKVSRDANKLEIKKAVEDLLNVKVDAVNTVLVKGKSKRFGRSQGRRQDFKKAYVSLKEGFDIDFNAIGTVE